MWKVVGYAIYFVCWFGLGFWAKKENHPKIETFAWLIGGISALMVIFAVIGAEVQYLHWK
jgi:hypothetical protein